MRNNIPRSDANISERQKQTQERIFRLAARDHGLSLKAISLDSGIGYTTIQSYARGEAVMSVASLFRLVGVIPDELLSLLLPDGRLILCAPVGVDYDEVSAHCRDFIDTKDKAHHPESEAGRDIGPTEHAVLGAKVTRLRAA